MKRALPRVLSYPPRHDYVDRLHGEVAALVERDQPWPRLPDLYDPTWVADHTDRWDVAHLHFTWEQYPVGTLSAIVDAHHAAGVPVVWTAHDLRNPHTGDEFVDEPYLRVLAEHADAVVTLTPGAAEEVTRRYHRAATVIPHGPLVPPAEASARRRRRAPDGTSTVLLHAKSLRANLDVTTPVAVTERLAAEGAAIRLLLAAHDEPGVRRQLAGLEDVPGVDVLYHPPWTPSQLWDAIADADVLLLPYRWGTHSGLLEVATDLGVPVVATDVGHLTDQAPCVPVRAGAEGIDERSLSQALRRVAGGELPEPVSWQAREGARAAFLEGHRRVYAALLAPVS